MTKPEPSWEPYDTREERILHATQSQPVRTNLLFVLELARRVLPLYEAAYPENKAPAEAIRLATLHLADPDTVARQDLLRAAGQASSAAMNAIPTEATYAAYAAANAARAVLLYPAGVNTTLHNAIESATTSMQQSRRNDINHTSPQVEAQALFQHVRGPLHTKFDPSWRTPDAVNLAREIVQTRNTDLLPILADALEEAGFNDETTLNQLRHEHSLSTPAHWVIRQLLGE